MEKFDYSTEMSAGDIGSQVTKQGSFNSGGKPVKGSGLDKAWMGPANTNGPHQVNFAKKSESMLGQESQIKKESNEVYMNAGK